MDSGNKFIQLGWESDFFIMSPHEHFYKGVMYKTHSICQPINKTIDCISNCYSGESITHKYTHLHTHTLTHKHQGMHTHTPHIASLKWPWQFFWLITASERKNQWDWERMERVADSEVMERNMMRVKKTGGGKDQSKGANQFLANLSSTLSCKKSCLQATMLISKMCCNAVRYFLTLQKKTFTLNVLASFC